MTEVDRSDPARAAAAVLVEALIPAVGDRVVRLGIDQRVPPDSADVWLLEPDPNYRSATELLDAVESVSADRGVVVLHFVGWPTSTRDCYPDVRRLPVDAVHPYTTLDPMLLTAEGPSDAVDRPAGAGPAWAIRDGGAANGVGTALDDYLARHPRRVAHRVLVGSGLAVIRSVDDAAAAGVIDAVAGWCGGDVAAAVDAERRALVARVATLQAQLADAGDGGPRLRGENARLRSLLREQTSALDEIARSAEELGYSSVLRLVDQVERVARRRRPGASVRQRIAAIRDRAAGARRDV